MDQPAAHLPLPKRADDLDAVRGHIERMLAGGDTAGALDLLFDLISRLRNHNEATQHRLLAALRKLYGRSSERFAPEEQGILQGILDGVAATTETELRPRKELVVHLDVAHRGIGTASCGPDVLPQYRITPGTYRFAYRLSRY